MGKKVVTLGEIMLRCPLQATLVSYSPILLM